MIRDLAMLTSIVAEEIDHYLKGKMSFRQLPGMREFISEFAEKVENHRDLSIITILCNAYAKVIGALTFFEDISIECASDGLRIYIVNPLKVLVNGQKNRRKDKAELVLLRDYMLEVSKAFQAENL